MCDMKLYVQRDSDEIDKDFASQLCRKIGLNILRLVNLKKLDTSIKYLQENNLMPDTVTSKKFIVYISKHIVCTQRDSRQVFMIDPNIKLKGCRVNLDTLCRTINYGNMQLRAYPIFTNALNHTSQQMNKYKDIYSFVGII